MAALTDQGAASVQLPVRRVGGVGPAVGLLTLDQQDLVPAPAQKLRAFLHGGRVDVVLRVIQVFSGIFHGFADG